MPRFEDEDRVFAYEYRCENDSLLFPLYRRLVCEPLLALIPPTLSPNVVTLLANLASVAAFVTLVALGTLVDTSGPLRLLFLVPAAGILLYVALDNTDGLQARRLGVSGPLGDFIDHWLDGFACFMIPLGIAIAYGADPRWRVPLVMAGVLAFWATAWERRHTGVLYLGRASDVEGNTAAIGAHLLTAIAGVAIWHVEIAGVVLVDGLMALTTLGLLGVALSILWRRGGGRDLIGVGTSMGLVAVWAVLAARRGVAARDSILVPVLVGLIGMKHVGDLHRNHLIGTVYRALDPAFLLGGAILVAALALTPAADRATPVPWALMAALFGYTAGALVYQWTHTVGFVCRRLEVNALTLTAAQKDAYVRARAQAT